MAKKNSKGPPCVIPYWTAGTNERKKFMKVSDVHTLFMSLLSRQALFDCARTQVRLFDLHNIDAIERMVIVEIPVMPSGFDANHALESDNLVTLSVPSDYIGRSSPVLNCGTLLRSSDFRKDSDESSIDFSKEKLTEKCTLESLIATKEQREQFKHPTEGVQLDAHDGGNAAFAIDCEMCKCGDESVLTRIAILSFDTGEVIADELVKPDREITDYVTEYSGITKEMLESVSFSLKDAQNLLRNIVGRTDSLIGHSLENDLIVLGVTHDRIIDTALLYPHIRGYPFRNSLRYISRKYLNTVIQNNTAEGHNPVVDARTCIELVKLIMEHGLVFGDVVAESLALSTFLKTKAALTTTYIGSRPPIWDAYGCANHQLKNTLNECVDATLNCNSNFVGVTLGQDLIHNAEALQSAIRSIIGNIPENVLFAVFIGPSEADVVEYSDLNKKKARFKTNYRTQKWDEIENPWTQSDGERLSLLKEKLSIYKGMIDINVDKNRVRELPKRIRENFLNTHPQYKEEDSEQTAPKRMKIQEN